MDGARQPPGKPASPELSVPPHYAALTGPMLVMNGDLLACHFGLWGPDTASDEEALLRANQALSGGCGLKPGRHVLDAGCGLGGTAIWLARTYGVRVTGLTNCEPHIAVATDQAQKHGFGHLVEFRHGDFMDLPFSEASFDAVFNHESFCYASDKLAYLRGVYRALKPGGCWQALEGLLSGAPLGAQQKHVHASMQWGFRMPSLSSVREVLATLEEAGFIRIREENLDSEVSPSTERTRKKWMSYRMVVPPPRGELRAYHEFMQAAMDFYEGLRQGAFTYRLLSGTKPA
ncbi:MAG: methyltransferase domain-containing protein [Gammaproteobacteria bacterium]|nr:methyltransferase domain-containing protein [Gammaproteobacteria bacterium]